MKDRMQLQTDEFDALNELIKKYRNLPPVVDDDYPEMRHYYESAVQTFLDACVANGRVVNLQLVRKVT